MCTRVGSNLGRDKTIQKIYDNPVVSSGKTNDDIRIFVQHNAKFPKSNAKIHPIVPII